MCGEESTEERKALSRRLGDRGDLVACLTSQIGDAVRRGDDIHPQSVEELRSAIGDIDEMLDDVEQSGRVATAGDEEAEEVAKAD